MLLSLLQDIISFIDDQNEIMKHFNIQTANNAKKFDKIQQRVASMVEDLQGLMKYKNGSTNPTIIPIPLALLGHSKNQKDEPKLVENNQGNPQCEDNNISSYNSLSETLFSNEIVKQTNGKEMDTSVSLIQQKQSNQSISSSDQFKEVNFSSNNNVSFESVYKNPLKCTLCKYVSTTKWNLKIHMRVHTGEKPYKCDVCGSRFSQTSTLTTHMRKHSGEKPFSCAVCGIRFAKRYTLTKHLRTHTGDKPYTCRICNAEFAQSGHLTIHMRVHTGEKPFQCTICNAKFAQRSNLSNHMRIHNSEITYSCTICESKYITSEELADHLLTHVSKAAV